MIVKENAKQLTFLFQEQDSYFEMGYLILKQANLVGMLPYKRIQQNGKEKLCFQISEVVKLSEVLPELSEEEVVDVLYAVVAMTQRVEENGFMKKECIWCKYDQIYYDKELHMPVFAVLPITKEFCYADGTDWEKGYEECLFRIAKYLSERKQHRMQQLVTLGKLIQMPMNELLEEINQLGNGMSGLLVEGGDGIPIEKQSKLELSYTGKDGIYHFVIGEQDFKIGRGAEWVDGDLRLSKMVSRIHCLITKVNKRYFVQDLAGLNGTFVNEIQVPPYELMELEHGDILRLADVEFTVRVIS